MSITFDKSLIRLSTITYLSITLIIVNNFIFYDNFGL